MSLISMIFIYVKTPIMLMYLNRPAGQWRSQHKIFGGQFFDVKPAAVFFKQINSFYSGDYFHYLADISPTYSRRLPQGNAFNYITRNLPITKNNEKCDVQKQKGQNRPTDHNAIGNE